MSAQREIRLNAFDMNSTRQDIDDNTEEVASDV